MANLKIKNTANDSVQMLLDTSVVMELGTSEFVAKTVNSISDLANASTTGAVNVLNYHSDVEGGGGVFYWDANKPKSKHNGGTVIDPTATFPTDWSNQTQLTTWFDSANTGNGCWVRQYDGAVNVKWFGAKGDGVADDTQAFKKALICKHVYVPKGVFLTTSTIYAISTTDDPITIEGESLGAVIKYSPASVTNYTNYAAFWFGNYTENTPASIYQCQNLTLKNFSVYMGTTARWGIRLRETLHTTMENVFIGGENYGELTNAVGLIADGGVHNSFFKIDIALKSGYGSGDDLPLQCLRIGNSSVLDGSAGSGSGATFTSSSFNNCYIHLANKLGSCSANQVAFNNCIFEAANIGLIAGEDSFNIEFVNCYFEAINRFAITANGIDMRAVSNIMVKGGYYQANGKSGYTGTDGFMLAKNAGKVKVTDMQIAGACIGRLIKCEGYTHNILLDGNNQTFNSSFNDSTPIKLTNPFTLYTGDTDFTLTYANHGLVAGDTIALYGFTSPLNGMDINQPLYKITSILDANNVAIRSLYTSHYASAYGSNMGGVGFVKKYNSGFAGNFLIDAPEATKILDGRDKELVFSRAFTGPGDNRPLYLQETIDRYITDSWCYVMTAEFQSSVAQTISGLNYCYVKIDFPDDYSKDIVLCSVPDIPINQYKNTTATSIGKKVPPGTSIRVVNFIAGGVPGYNYDQSLAVTVRVVEMQERLSA